MDFELVADGLSFPEGPRWHDGAFWCSDIGRGQVLRIEPGGPPRVVLALEGDAPSGLGFLPDGTLLVVAMRSRRLLAVHDGRSEVHADLSALPGDFLNDMVVDRAGRAYVGTRTASLTPWGPMPERAPDVVAVVEPDGTVGVAADGLFAPNGMVLTADGRGAVLAETYARRLSAFDVGPDGALSGRRVFAETAPVRPDGICLDAEGAVWVGSPYTHELVRVGPDGAVVARHPVPGAVACVLGGPERTTLYVAAVDPTAIPPEDRPPERPGIPEGLTGGRILSARVEVPGAGLP
jgi:sugar lactone lactonase YvrE